MKLERIHMVLIESCERNSTYRLFPKAFQSCYLSVVSISSLFEKLIESYFLFGLYSQPLYCLLFTLDCFCFIYVVARGQAQFQIRQSIRLTAPVAPFIVLIVLFSILSPEIYPTSISLYFLEQCLFYLLFLFLVDLKVSEWWLENTADIIRQPFSRNRCPSSSSNVKFFYCWQKFTHSYCLAVLRHS